MNEARIKWIISGIEYDSLTEKEQKFIESAESYFERHGDLTEAQEDWLEDIFKEKSR